MLPVYSNTLLPYILWVLASIESKVGAMFLCVNIISCF